LPHSSKISGFMPNASKTSARSPTFMLRAAARRLVDPILLGLGGRLVNLLWRGDDLNVEGCNCSS
jgi:hypothetical protein